MHIFGLMGRSEGQHTGERLSISLRTGAACSLVAAGIYCCFETPLEWPASASFLLLPISILLIPLPGNGNVQTAPSRRWPWIWVALPAALCWVWPGIGLVQAVYSGIYGDLGYRQLISGRYEEAARTLEKAHAVWPYRPDILDRHTEAMLMQGKLEEAALSAEKSLVLRPMSARTMGIYGRCLMRLGRDDECRPYLKGYISKIGFNEGKEALYLLGKVYLRSGAAEAALSIFQRLHKAHYQGLAGPDLPIDMARALLLLAREPSTAVNLMQSANAMKRCNEAMRQRILWIIEGMTALYQENPGLKDRLKLLKERVEKNMESAEEDA
jgi:tetratricopeptide (TPR) repeat protein